MIGTKTMGVTAIITLFIALLIGVTLINPFAAEVTDAYNNTENSTTGKNITGGAHTIVGLYILFFALILIVSMVKWGFK